jgi:hypothetical protein
VSLACTAKTPRFRPAISESKFCGGFGGRQHRTRFILEKLATLSQLDAAADALKQLIFSGTLCLERAISVLAGDCARLQPTVGLTPPSGHSS